jgi:hypothetical protein
MDSNGEIAPNMSHRLREVSGQGAAVRRSRGAERSVAAGVTTGQTGPRVNIWHRTSIRRMPDASRPFVTVVVPAAHVRRHDLPSRRST